MKLKSVLKVALALVAICSLFVACDTLAGGRFPLSGETNWYYIDIPLDTPNIIFNDGKVQTADITGIDVSEGSVYYEWDATVDKIMPVVYDSSKKPEGKAGRVWVYTNSTKTPNCYWWGSVEGENPSWPGKPMSLIGEEPAVGEDYKLTIVADGFTAGDKVLVNGSLFGWNGWPFVGWLGWNDGVQDTALAEEQAASWIAEYAETQVVTADSEGKIKLVVELTTDVVDQKIKLVKTTVTDGKYEAGDDTGDIPVTLPAEGGEYYVYVTFEKGSTTAAEVTTPPTTKILVTNNHGWETMNLYYWGNGVADPGWPGITLTEKTVNDFGEEQYTAYVPAGVTHIIFNNGNGAQTVDIEFDPTKAGYWIGAAGDDGKYAYGSW